MIEDIVIFAITVIVIFIYLMIAPNLIMLMGKTPFVGTAFVTVETVIKPRYFVPLASHTLKSLLLSHDLDTGMSVREILSVSAYTGRKEVEIDGKIVNVEEIVNKKMKFFLPSKDFLLIVGRLKFGNTNLKSEYSASTYITLPNGKEVKVILYVG